MAVVTGIRQRPTLYTPQLADEIVERIQSGETLLAIVSEDRMPEYSTVVFWSEEGTHIQATADGFPAKYARARLIRNKRMAEELEHIADDARNDWMDRVVSADGDTVRVVDHEHVMRSKLRVDTRKWLLSKLLPHDYGDRVAHQMLDEHGKPAKAGITVIIDGAPRQIE